MPVWLFVVLVAHLLNALAFLIDKFLLTKAMTRPTVYAFFVGILGALSFVLLPFSFSVPTPHEALLDGAAGASFVVALLLFFTALKRGEASRIIPYVGGTIPIWTFLFAYVFLGERLGGREIIAFGILVVGSALVSQGDQRSATRRRRAYTVASLSAVMFAGSFVLMKAIFLQQAFIPGFVWSRAGAVIAALLILVHGESRRAIFSPTQRPSGRMAALFFSGQLAGAMGFLALQYAVSLASPTLVNALQGIQYAFLFVLVLVLGQRFPQLRERLSRRVITQKTVAIIVIAAGLMLLTQSSSI